MGSREDAPTVAAAVVAANSWDLQVEDTKGADKGTAATAGAAARGQSEGRRGCKHGESWDFGGSD